MNETQKKYSAQFVQSAAHLKELPKSVGEEYAVMGRSNVGKSTFINHALMKASLARVSKRPGKTTLANLYRLTDGLFWVDLPGYGYAKAPGAEKDRWSRLLADYCGKRKGLAGVIWLLDIRHPGLEVDMEAFQWFGEIGLPIFPVLTKGDKLSKSTRKKHAAEFRKIFRFDGEPIIYSSLEHESRERFWSGFDVWRRSIGGRA